MFLVKGPRTAPIQEGLDCLGLYHSGLEGERHFRLAVELTWIPPDAHPACVGSVISTDVSGVSVTAPPRLMKDYTCL